MTFSNKVYDVLKWIAQLLLPGLATLYFALAAIWGFPYAEQVLGTIAAIEAFLGCLLKISTSSYKGDGTLTIYPDEPGGDLEAEINIPIEELAKKDDLLLKVEKVCG